MKVQNEHVRRPFKYKFQSGGNLAFRPSDPIDFKKLLVLKYPANNVTQVKQLFFLSTSYSALSIAIYGSSTIKYRKGGGILQVQK